MLEKILSVIEGIFWCYKKSPNISLKNQVDNDAITLVARNTRDVDVEIKHIRLVRKRPFRKNVEFDKNSFFALYNHPKDSFNLSTQNDDLNIALDVNSKAIELEIKIESIFNLYEYFIPYKIHDNYHVKYLDNPTKMTSCHIALYLRSGKIKYIKLPEIFYSMYKQYLENEYKTDIDILSGRSRVKISFETDEAYSKHKDQLLDLNSICYKNSLLLRR